MRTIETKKMVLAVLTATVVLTLAVTAYIEPASAHHREGHERACDLCDEPDSGEAEEEIKEAQDEEDEVNEIDID